MKRSLVMLAQAMAAAALLAGCGGGGGGGEPPAPQPGPLDAVPPDASTSVSGMVAYLAALVALAPESAEPLDVESFSPPTPEDAEPQPLS